MPSPERKVDSQTDLPARELLTLYDELTALHASSTFVMQALAAALVHGGGLDERSATGAVFCTQWLNDRTAELERQLKSIVSQAYASRRQLARNWAGRCEQDAELVVQCVGTILCEPGWTDWV